MDEVTIDQSESHNDAFAAYLTEGGKEKDREPIYCEEIGLAIEKLPPGYTITKLWDALAN